MDNHFANLSGGSNTTHSNASNHRGQTFGDSECIIIRILFVFTGSVGLLENIAVVAIILHSRIMLDFPSNWFVLSLAIADAIFCFAAIPLINALCSGASYLILIGVIAQFLTIASAGNLFILTFNRFLSVYNSLRYPGLMTYRRAKCLVVIPWGIAFLMSVLVGISVQAGNQDMPYLHSSYYTTLIILTIGLNIYMFTLARSKRRVTVQQQSAVLAAGDKLLGKEFRLLIRLLVVTLTFFGACIPTMVLMYLYPTAPSRQTRSFQRKIIWCLLALLFNAVINPLIYSSNHPIFKRYLNKVQNRILPQHSIAPLVNT
jgi:phage shock protein PspC (stress-responsive transcriptional regulator)